MDLIKDNMFYIWLVSFMVLAFVIIYLRAKERAGDRSDVDALKARVFKLESRLIALEKKTESF